jgi:hypothetical protein
MTGVGISRHMWAVSNDVPPPVGFRWRLRAVHIELSTYPQPLLLLRFTNKVVGNETSAIDSLLGNLMVALCRGKRMSVQLDFGS